MNTGFQQCHAMMVSGTNSWQSTVPALSNACSVHTGRSVLEDQGIRQQHRAVPTARSAACSNQKAPRAASAAVLLVERPCVDEGSTRTEAGVTWLIGGQARAWRPSPIAHGVHADTCHFTQHHSTPCAYARSTWHNSSFACHMQCTRVRRGMDAYSHF